MAAKKGVSLKTIANAAGVSVSTASLVLNNRGEELRIAENTQQKIRQIAHSLGYLSDDAVSTYYKLSPFNEDKLYKVAIFFVDTFMDFPLERFHKGIVDYCNSSSYNIDWVYHPFVPNKLAQYSHLFTPKHYDGIIITTPYENDAAFLKENHFPIPIILYNYQINGYTCICHDDFEIGSVAAEVFYKHRKESIAIVTPLICNRGISLRLAGFRNYLENVNFPMEHLHITNGTNKNMDGGYIAISKLINQESIIPSAIYVINDLMTPGVVNCLTQNHIRIPEDVEILSYGNISAASISPSISSYVSESEKMAYTCIENIFLELSGAANPGLYYSFGTYCIWRESCKEI